MTQLKYEKIRDAAKIIRTLTVVSKHLRGKPKNNLIGESFVS